MIVIVMGIHTMHYMWLIRHVKAEQIMKASHQSETERVHKYQWRKRCETLAQPRYYTIGDLDKEHFSRSFMSYYSPQY